jgi:hypothetical protein
MMSGQHTADEVLDLVEFLDWRIGQMRKLFAEVPQQGPEDWDWIAIERDFLSSDRGFGVAGLVPRYDAARAEVKRNVAKKVGVSLVLGGPVGAALAFKTVPDEEDWHKLQLVWNTQLDSSPPAPKEDDGLLIQERIQKRNPRPMDPMPPMFRSTDAEMVILRGADAAATVAKGGAEAGATAAGTVVRAAREEQDSFIEAHWTKMLVGGIAVGGAYLFARKRGLL